MKRETTGRNISTTSAESDFPLYKSSKCKDKIEVTRHIYPLKKDAQSDR